MLEVVKEAHLHLTSEFPPPTHTHTEAESLKTQAENKVLRSKRAAFRLWGGTHRVPTQWQNKGLQGSP